jgi:predicted ArsR family transcriptional regulator
MRALSHPLKWALMEVLLLQGSATSTRCAELVGASQANCSFHLRQLARYGLVEAAPTESKKERPWQLTTVNQSWSRLQPDPERAQAAAELERVFVQYEVAKLMRWERTWRAFGNRWRRAAMRSAATTWLTADELAELGEQISELMVSYGDRLTDPSKRPAHSRPVRLFATAYPLPEEDNRGLG